jgi:phenylpyruvate tautomerase PptA (4-oxalocrotonate tautomerase family)
MPMLSVWYLQSLSGSFTPQASQDLIEAIPHALEQVFGHILQELAKFQSPQLMVVVTYVRGNLFFYSC